MPTTPDDKAALTAYIVVLATQYGRYGYGIREERRFDPPTVWTERAMLEVG